MRNPFEKDDHSALIAGLVIGSVAAGAAAYLFLTENGGSIRRKIGDQLLALRKSFMAEPEEAPIDHSMDYMHPKKKAPKTDRDFLLHHDIIEEHVL